jgi:hypothetical protein
VDQENKVNFIYFLGVEEYGFKNGVKYFIHIYSTGDSFYNWLKNAESASGACVISSFVTRPCSCAVFLLVEMHNKEFPAAL